MKDPFSTYIPIAFCQEVKLTPETTLVKGVILDLNPNSKNLFESHKQSSTTRGTFKGFYLRVFYDVEHTISILIYSGHLPHILSSVET
jgi:hypothetical protein